MKVWTVHVTGYELARDILKCHEFEDFSPFGVYTTRRKAEEEVLKALNEYRADERDCEQDVLPGMTEFPDLSLDDLKWHDCHVANGGRLRWKHFDELSEDVYVITKLVIDE